MSLEKGSPELYALVSDTTSDGHKWLPSIMPDGDYKGDKPEVDATWSATPGVSVPDSVAPAPETPAPAPAPASSTAGQVIPGLVTALSMLTLGMFAAI